MTFTPLGDQAILAYAPSEAAAIRFTTAIRTANPAWLEDVVPAYSSVGVFFNANRIRAESAMTWLKSLRLGTAKVDDTSRLFMVPVCYEMGPDLARIAESTGLDAAAVIARHEETPYTVYAVGFVPGFPYLGYLPAELCGVPRLDSPRLRVEPGSVGLTGRQTGIYPLARPAGWSLIGRTPLTIVDVADSFFPLHVGDVVRFTRIDDAEYRKLHGERLAPERNP